MSTIIHVLFTLFLLGIILGFVITVFWFCYAMLVNFYKIYLKQPKKDCQHTNTTYHDGLYDFWKCNDCGGNFPE